MQLDTFPKLGKLSNCNPSLAGCRSVPGNSSCPVGTSLSTSVEGRDIVKFIGRLACLNQICRESVVAHAWKRQDMHNMCASDGRGAFEDA